MKKVALKAKQVNKDLAKFNLNLSKKDQVQLVDNRVIVVNGEVSFFKYEEEFLPTLKYLQEHLILPKIVVDMGAIKFVINGADIMRPGIVSIDESISEGDPVAIVDENNNKALAVGIAKYSSEDLQSMDSGKVIKNIHFVGDEIWEM